MTYKEQLQTKEWKYRRLKILLCAQFKCEQCGHDNPNQLQVHHKRYIDGKMAWEYDRVDLMVLCRYCHYTHHRPEITDKKRNSNHISSIIPKVINNG